MKPASALAILLPSISLAQYPTRGQRLPHFSIASSKNLKLYPLNPAGQRLQALDKADDGRFILGTTPTLWYELAGN